MKSLNYFTSNKLDVNRIFGGNDIPPCTPDLSGLTEDQRRMLEEMLKKIQ